MTDLNRFEVNGLNSTMSQAEVYEEALSCSCCFIRNVKNQDSTSSSSSSQTGLLLVFDWFLNENDKSFLRYINRLDTLIIE